MAGSSRSSRLLCVRAPLVDVVPQQLPEDRAGHALDQVVLAHEYAVVLGIPADLERCALRRRRLACGRLRHLRAFLAVFEQCGHGADVVRQDDECILVVIAETTGFCASANSTPSSRSPARIGTAIWLCDSGKPGKGISSSMRPSGRDWSHPRAWRARSRTPTSHARCESGFLRERPCRSLPRRGGLPRRRRIPDTLARHRVELLAGRVAHQHHGVLGPELPAHAVEQSIEQAGKVGGRARRAMLERSWAREFTRSSQESATCGRSRSPIPRGTRQRRAA